MVFVVEVEGKVVMLPWLGLSDRTVQKPDDHLQGLAAFDACI